MDEWQEFIKLPGEKLDRIISHASEPVLEIIASTIWSLCMKMNLTETEALECVGKVKERKMGYLFENMEKIDIQAERKAAKEAKRDAEEAKRDAEEAKRDAEEAKRDAEKARRDAEDVRKALEVAEQKVDVAEQKNQATVVTMCQEFGGTKELAISKLQEKCGLSMEEARRRVEIYWKK